jgi:hypothetical protein
MTFKLNREILTFLVLVTTGLTLYSCKDKSNIKSVNANDLTLSPVVHDTLSTAQIEKIKKIQTTFAEVNPSSLEETITNFKRDRNPDNEIAIWLVMASAYENFISKRATLNLDKKEEVYKLILMRSMYNEAEAKIKSELKLLTDKEVLEIFSYYDLDAKPITVEQK